MQTIVIFPHDGEFEKKLESLEGRTLAKSIIAPEQRYVIVHEGTIMTEALAVCLIENFKIDEFILRA